MCVAMTAVPIDLRRPGRYHVVGVGGPGTSALALVLVGMGHDVSGSDRAESAMLDRLRSAGVRVLVGHSEDHVRGCDAVTASSAVPSDNIELVAARAQGITVLSRGEMLAAICACADTVAIAGTAGKTTVTSMLAMVLETAGLAPSWIVGGDAVDLGGGARWTGGRLLVVEADESDGTFRELPVHATVLTNVHVDHLDHFGTVEAIAEGFDAYLAAVAGPKVVCADDPIAARLGAVHGATTYGLSANAHWQAREIVTSGPRQRFTVRHLGEEVGVVALGQPGAHNVRNALGALAMAVELGVPVDVATDALAGYSGVARRFDRRGTRKGITFVDDYAHIPTKIEAAIEAAHSGNDGWDRVVVVFQPNRYSRMSVMTDEYRDAFVGADLVVITEIYPSGERRIPGVTAASLAELLRQAHPDRPVVWLPEREQLVSWLARELEPGDLCLSMGCGDIALLPDEVQALMEREQ
jgi:UDP-N-acetylmuramate--alanine ligase